LRPFAGARGAAWARARLGATGAVIKKSWQAKGAAKADDAASEIKIGEKKQILRVMIATLALGAKQ
jgi:hypothetical protein